MLHNALQITEPKQWILENQEAIFEFYTKSTPSKSLIKSPVRVDKTPTCGYYYNEKGVLKLHDFATNEFYSAVDLVKALFNINYYKAVEKIIEDSPNFIESLRLESSPRTNVSWIMGDPAWLPKYFDRYKVITADLLMRYKVFPSKAVVTDTEVLAKGYKNNPMFVYIIDDKIKWYKPLSPNKEKKWGGTTNSESLLGFAQLPKKGTILFITSSLKDVMVLRGLGFSAIAFNGEGYGHANSKTEKTFRNKLVSLDKRFKHIIFYMNNDEAGLQANINLARTYNKKYIANPRGYPKDISDFIQRYGVRRTYRMLKKQLSHEYQSIREAVLPY